MWCLKQRYGQRAHQCQTKCPFHEFQPHVFQVSLQRAVMAEQGSKENCCWLIWSANFFPLCLFHTVGPSHRVLMALLGVEMLADVPQKVAACEFVSNETLYQGTMLCLSKESHLRSKHSRANV